MRKKEQQKKVTKPVQQYMVRVIQISRLDTTAVIGGKRVTIDVLSELLYTGQGVCLGQKERYTSNQACLLNRPVHKHAPINAIGRVEEPYSSTSHRIYASRISNISYQSAVRSSLQTTSTAVLLYYGGI